MEGREKIFVFVDYIGDKTLKLNLVVFIYVSGKSRNVS